MSLCLERGVGGGWRLLLFDLKAATMIGKH